MTLPVGQHPPLDEARLDRDPASGKFTPGTAVGQATRFRPANRDACRHGVRALEVRGVTALDDELRAALERFHAGVVADQGGEPELTTIRSGYARKLTHVEGVIELLMADVRAHGILTARGRVRGTFLALLKTLDTWDRYAQRLGVERRQRQVPTLAEYLRARSLANEGSTGSLASEGPTLASESTE